MEINNTYQMHTSLLHDNFKKNLTLKLVLFIIAPFFSFLYSLRKLNSKSSLIIFFLFGMLYAWSMDCHIEAYDFTRISRDFYLQNYTTEEVFNEIHLFFIGESNAKELYKLVLTWFAQLFSNNYHTMYLLASIPFLFFMLKSLRLITGDRQNFDNSFYFFVLVVLFIAPFDLFQLSNYRFPTAAWIAIYSLLQIFQKQQIKYYLLLLITPYIHSGLWPMLIFLLIYKLLPKNLKFFKIIFFISIPFAFVETNLLSLVNFNFLPERLASWGNEYLSADMVAKFGMYRSGSGFYIIEILIRKSIVAAYLYGVFISLNHKSEHLIKKNINLLTFIIYLFTIVNFMQIVPTLGERYLRMAEVLFIFFWFKTYSTPISVAKSYKKYIYFIFTPFIYILLYEKVRYYLDTTNIDFYISNVFSIIDANLGVTHYGQYN